MGQQEITIIDEPVDGFEIQDLFMSRTDHRGVILSGNDTFQRLSGFDWPELIGTPHRLIRHPEMPKAAFHLLWEALEKGEPFGAYVKNRAKDGRYYWVFAAAVPVEDGYLSVRLKPTSPILETVQGLYSDLLNAERNDALSPEQSAALAEDRITGLGYRNYHAFMGYALGVEIAARCEALGTTVDPGIGEFEKIGQLLADLAEEVKGVQRLYATIGNSPANLNILGSRLTSGREPIQVVAQNYGVLSSELMGVISELDVSLEALLDKAYLGRAGHCASLLYSEAIEKYRTEEANRGTRGHTNELAILQRALRGFLFAAQQGCDQIRHEVSQFAKITARLKQMLSGLALTRVICRIESASVAEDTSSIDEIANRLMTFQDELGVALENMATMCSTMAGKIPGQKGAAVERKMPAKVES